MIVSVEKGDHGIVRDVYGVEVKLCIKADTETGECEAFKVGHDGGLFLGGDGLPVRLTVKRRARLTFERTKVPTVDAGGIEIVLED